MFDAVADLSWRALPAAVMAAAGAYLAWAGTRRGWGFARAHDPARNLDFIRGFRLAVVGLALLGVAAAWMWHLGWLLVLALVIGIGEVLESSLDAYAVQRGIRRGYVSARPGSGSRRG